MFTPLDLKYMDFKVEFLALTQFFYMILAKGPGVARGKKNLIFLFLNFEFF